ncbi:MAG: hypothetical protein WC147_06625 [Syntrophomonas sp.]
MTIAVGDKKGSQLASALLTVYVHFLVEGMRRLHRTIWINYIVGGLKSM